MAGQQVVSDPEKAMVIRKVTPEITTLSAPWEILGKFKIGGRGTLVRLRTGSVAVFSPVALTEEVKRTVAALGTLKYIVALNIEHHVFLTPWSQAYPDARVIGVEGLPEKREANPATRGLNFSTVFTASQRTEIKISDEFDAEIDVEYMPSHSNHEVVFCHRPSRTLITADLVFNLPATEQFSKSDIAADAGIWTKLVIQLLNAGSVRGQRMFLWYGRTKQDRKGFAESVRRIDAWDFDRIIPCHGDVVEEGAKKIFQNIMEWHRTLIE